jgi:hypothetical protein
MSAEPGTEEWKEKPHAIGWWQTFPGIVTALAGLLTALAGLILALHQVGLLGNEKEHASVTTPVNTSASLTADKPNNSSKTGEINNSTESKAEGSSPNIPAYSVSFPEGSTVTLNSSRAQGVYSILKTQVERRSPEKLNLTLTVRLTNKGKLDLNFWDSTFRLLIDEVPRAPISYLNVLVDARSAKEGDIIFEVPVAAKQLVLQLSNNEDSVTIPLRLAKEK